MSDWTNAIKKTPHQTNSAVIRPRPLNLMVTLWPSFPHFSRFAYDHRLSGIRLNSAMISTDELDKELEIIASLKDNVPLWFDIKGRQLRIREVFASGTDLEVEMNHPIEVETPTVVLFKAGADRAILKSCKGTRLVFDGGPEFMVKPGESIHIRHPSLKVQGPTFSDFEIEKIKKVVAAGFQRYFLSYVENQADVDAFRKYIGPDAALVLKIENKIGLDFVASGFVRQKNTSLMAARGDLYVEVDKPHQVLEAIKLIIKADPTAHVGSRLLLSLVNNSVPEMADMSDMAWLYDIGYRSMMLCDELCLKEDLLSRAVNCMNAFKQSYSDI